MVLALMSADTLAPATRAWRSHDAVRAGASCAANGPLPATIVDAASSVAQIPARATPRIPARRPGDGSERPAAAWLIFMNKLDSPTSPIRLADRPEAITLR